MADTDTPARDDGKGTDSLAEFKELFAEQRARESLLRHVQQFLKSPMFIDLREASIEVSDPPEVIEERKAEIDHRIRVVESLLRLLLEEREALDRTVSADAGTGTDAPDSPPDAGDDDVTRMIAFLDASQRGIVR